jgi:hypothetical protein
MLQFKRAYKRNDKPVCIAASMFIAHLANQQVGDRNTGFGHSVVSAAVFYGKAQAFVSHLLLLWANLRPSWPCLPLQPPLSNTHTGQYPFPIIATLTSHLTAVAHHHPSSAQVVHELLPLEVLLLLLEAPSDDSVEMAVDFLKEAGWLGGQGSGHSGGSFLRVAVGWLVGRIVWLFVVSQGSGVQQLLCVSITAPLPPCH